MANLYYDSTWLNPVPTYDEPQGPSLKNVARELKLTSTNKSLTQALDLKDAEQLK